MNKINVHFRDYDSWSITGTTYWKGSAFFEELLLDVSSIACMFSSIKNADDFISSLKQLNGFFAVVQQKEDTIYAAVDRVRSVPLFYSLKDGDFYISDDPNWIQKEIQSDEVDEIAAAEFMLTGYVTGKDTLYPDIKQLQAGEALVLQHSSDCLSLRTIQYYRYIPKNYSVCSEEEILSVLDRVLVKVFERLIKIASGRTIVVPLSGGYDSRLIVLMLKRLGYEKVVAFSYGKPGNKESEISKKVAEILGIRWEFIPYNNEDWHKWYRSEEFKRYSRMACGLSSVPHIQDWPAVWELKRRELIPNDSLFVPGHGADILSGRVTNIVADCPVDPIEAIFKQNYILWRCSSDKYVDLFKNRIARSFDKEARSQDIVSLFESWRVRERHAKFIINSLRVYEFWNYSWWIPFWDVEFMDLWCEISADMKSDQKIYKIYVNNIFGKISHRHICTDKESWKSRFMNSAMVNLKRTPFLDLARNAYRHYRLLNAYGNNSFAFYGAITKDRFIKLYTGIEEINSFLAADMIDSLSSDSEMAKKILIMLMEKK